MKIGREYHGCWEEYYLEKRETGNNIISVGKNIKGERGEGDEHFWEENQDLKKWVWGRISSRRKLYTSLSKGSLSLVVPGASTVSLSRGRCSSSRPSTGTRLQL